MGGYKNSCFFLFCLKNENVFQNNDSDSVSKETKYCPFLESVFIRSFSSYSDGINFLLVCVCVFCLVQYKNFSSFSLRG